jgi:CubicO group peptidase (beta-lactamase class C family)
MAQEKKVLDTMRSVLRRIALPGLVVAGASAFAAATASPPATPPTPIASALPASPAGPAHELTTADAEAWLDGLMPAAMHTAQVPGAVVAIVHKGEIVLEKGYGYADLAKHVKVDAKETLFRPGSTSKLFTWTAVMQLVEQGKIDLDADVNKYLDFTIPAYEGQPMTMRQIMTHTTGFEETIQDLIAFDEAEPPLGDVLKGNIPVRNAAPGSLSAYSNYGAALAGYIVQRVSGEPFETYVEQHIFAPLGMSSTSFRQPLPPALLARVATGYENSNKPGLGYELINMPPAGSSSTSADDIARFMIAHLHEGKYQDAQILQPKTAAMMHDTITRHYPDLNGIALGFYEQNVNGHRVIAHGGDLNYFHSDLALFLDDDTGVFISVNALGKEGLGEMLREGMFRAFADRYYPTHDAPRAPLDAATAKAHAALIAGTYVTSRNADHTFLSITKLVMPTVVTANADGTITTQTLLDPLTYVEVKPFLWQQVDGPDKLQAIVKDGKVVRWSTNDLAFGFEFVAPGGLPGSGLAVPLCLAAIAIFVIAALQWPGAALVRRWYRRPLAFTGRRALAYHLAGLAPWVALAALATWTVFFQEVSATQSGHLTGFLHAAQFVAALGFAGGWLACLWNLVLQVREGQKWPVLLWSVVRLAAFSLFAWIGFNYHLIDVSGKY